MSIDTPIVLVKTLPAKALTRPACTSIDLPLSLAKQSHGPDRDARH
jgi:hypothetical protein